MKKHIHRDGEGKIQTHFWKMKGYPELEEALVTLEHDLDENK